jgi:hypothetical protein
VEKHGRRGRTPQPLPWPGGMLAGVESDAAPREGSWLSGRDAGRSGAA